MQTHCVHGTILSTMHLFSHLILRRSRLCYYLLLQKDRTQCPPFFDTSLSLSTGRQALLL